MIQALNRSILLVYYKEAFINFIQPVLEENETLEDLNESPMAFTAIIDTDHTPESGIPELSELEKATIMEVACKDWMGENHTFRIPSTAEFNTWFEVDLMEDVYDLNPEFEIYAQDDEDLDEMASSLEMSL